MLEDQVAYLLQRYLGNYVTGLNKKALYISVWKGLVKLLRRLCKSCINMAPEGSLGCVAVAAFEEPEPDLLYCLEESLDEQTEFEAQKIWSEPDSYPWAFHVYQVQSVALHFVAQRQGTDGCDWKPRRVCAESPSQSRQDNPRTT